MLKYALVVFLFSASCLNAGEEVPLSAEEIDSTLDGILKRAGEITRLYADIETTKTGGVFAKQSVAFETLWLQAPDRVKLINRGASRKPVPWDECSLLLFDGEHYWELEPRFAENEPRIATRRPVKQAGVNQGAGLAGFLSYFLLGGRDTATVKELREEFEISGFRETDETGASYHFILKPRQEGEAMELWFRENEILPWKVKTVEKKKIITIGKSDGGEKFKLVEEVRVLKNLKTNLSGLEPFTSSVFIFPVEKNMTVTDEQTGAPVSPEQLAEELKLLRKKFEAEEEKARQKTGSGDNANSRD